MTPQYIQLDDPGLIVCCYMENSIGLERVKEQWLTKSSTISFHSSYFNDIFSFFTGIRLAPVLKTIFHQCVISYTCSQSNSDGSKTEPSELDWLQVYDDTLMKNCFKAWSQSTQGSAQIELSLCQHIFLASQISKKKQVIIPLQYLFSLFYF